MRLLLLALLLVLAMVDVHGALVELYNSYKKTANCSARVSPDEVSVYPASLASGSCFPVNDGFARFACHVGGTVKYERFSDEQCSGPVDDRYEWSWTGTDRACFQPTDYTSYFVDCTAMQPLPTVVAKYRSRQLFSDATCLTPLEGEAGLQGWRASPDGCSPSGGGDFEGHFSTADGRGVLRVAATNSDCTEWRDMYYTPLNACTPMAGSSSMKYEVHTRPVGALPPFTFPPATNNSILFVRCTDAACSEDCRVSTYSRTGVCRTRPFGSYIVHLSVDGRYQTEILYADNSCSRVSEMRAPVRVTPLSRAVTCDKHRNRFLGHFYTSASSFPAATAHEALLNHQLQLSPFFLLPM